MKRLCIAMLIFLLLAGCGNSQETLEKETSGLEISEMESVSQEAEISQESEEESTTEEVESTESISEATSIEEIYSNLKESVLEVVSNTEYSDMQTSIQLYNFEDSFFYVYNLNEWPTTKNNNTLSEFLVAISYFSLNLPDNTIGGRIGALGWDAIESLVLDDGNFHQKMDELKSAYEETGNMLFENKYEEGQYKVGVDIEPGEYVFFTTSSGYFSLSRDANGKDIIENDNFEYNDIMTLNEGEYLKLSRCYAVPIQDVTYLPVDMATMFKVGDYIDAGEYKIIADNDSAYYCIYEDARMENIVANDNFSGQSYIKISDGQYLKLSRCHIEQ